MGHKKPIVLTEGQLEQIQEGDYVQVLSEQLNNNSTIASLLNEILEEQKKTNKLLTKIYK